MTTSEVKVKAIFSMFTNEEPAVETEAIRGRRCF